MPSESEVAAATHCKECLYFFKIGDRLWRTKHGASEGWTICENCFIIHIMEDLVKLGQSLYSMPVLEMFKFFFGPEGDPVFLQPLMEALRRVYLNQWNTPYKKEVAEVAPDIPIPGL